MMPLDSSRLVVRRCSGCLVLLLIAAAMSWVTPGYTDESSDAPFDLNSVPFHFTQTGDLDDFRGGTLTWEPDPNVINGVIFTLKVTWTRSDFKGGSDTDGFPCPGDIVFNSTGTQLFFADGPARSNHSPPLFFLVTSIDKASDLMESVALRPGSATQTTIPYKFVGTGATSPCNNGCRSALSQRVHIGPVGNRFQEQENNPSKGWRLGTCVTPCTGDRSPVATLPPGSLVRLASGQLSKISFQISDPDPGTHYEFRQGLFNEAGGQFVNWPLWLRIQDSATGVLEANTTGLADRTNWSAQLICEEITDDTEALVSSAAIDFTLQVIDCGINAHGPSFDATASLGCGTGTTSADAPACGSTVNVTVGHQLCFPVQASDVDGGGPYGIPEADQLSLSASGLPAGATLDPALPRVTNPVSTQLCWTPTLADAGDHVVTFSVDDVCHNSSCDITIHVNRDPDCSQAQPMLHTLPNNHHYYPINILGVTDPDGDPVTVCVTSVTSDEATSGGACPDAIISSCNVSLAGERNSGGNGRVYVVHFTATDGKGGSCSGTVTVDVQASGGGSVDDGQIYDATIGPCPVPTTPESQGQVATTLGLNAVRVSGGLTTVEYSLPSDGDVMIAVFDIAGRRMGTLVNGRQTAGSHQATWNSGGLSRGIYYYRMQATGRTLTRSIYMK